MQSFVKLPESCSWQHTAVIQEFILELFNQISQCLDKRTKSQQSLYFHLKVPIRTELLLLYVAFPVLCKHCLQGKAAGLNKQQTTVVNVHIFTPISLECLGKNTILRLAPLKFPTLCRHCLKVACLCKQGKTVVKVYYFLEFLSCILGKKSHVHFSFYKKKFIQGAH